MILLNEDRPWVDAADLKGDIEGVEGDATGAIVTTIAVAAVTVGIRAVTEEKTFASRTPAVSVTFKNCVDSNVANELVLLLLVLTAAVIEEPTKAVKEAATLLVLLAASVKVYLASYITLTPITPVSFARDLM